MFSVGFDVDFDVTGFIAVGFLIKFGLWIGGVLGFLFADFGLWLNLYLFCTCVDFWWLMWFWVGCLCSDLGCLHYVVNFVLMTV